MRKSGADRPVEIPGQRVSLGRRLLHAMRAGAGEPCVVFESGGGGGSALQDLPVLRRVSMFTQAIAYDRAGQGWSDPAPNGRSFHDRASDLRALLAALGISSPIILVGSSFGGLLARAYAQQWPGDVAGMVLIDTADEEKYFSTMLGARRGLEESLRAEAARADSGALLQDIGPAIAAANVFTDAEKGWIRELLSHGSHHRAALEELSAIDATRPETKRVGGFGRLGDLPLVVVSHGQPYVGEMADWEVGWSDAQQRLAALSSQGRHIVAKRLGHSIALENPALVAAAVRAVFNAVNGQPLNTRELERLAGE